MIYIAGTEVKRLSFIMQLTVTSESVNIHKYGSSKAGKRGLF